MTEIEIPHSESKDPGSLMSMDSKAAHITSPVIWEKFKKKKLSASLVSGLQGCHGRWLADSFVMGELIDQEPDNPGRRGSLFHYTMELFFAHPKEDRTHDAMRQAVKDALNSEEFEDMKKMPEAVKWLRNAVNNYYNMGGRPQEVDIATIIEDGEEKSGIELFVQGKIGDTKRNILGFIDQVIQDPSNPDAYIIQDWKSGAKVKKWKAHTKSDDGYAEQRQQIIYTELMRQAGHKISGARLIFPVPKEVVDVVLDDEALRNRVISDVEEADRTLDILEETNEFELRPDFLCHWCSLSKICSAFTKVSNYEKPRKAFESQPDPEVLMKGIEIL